jgi:hypothetical protein
MAGDTCIERWNVETASEVLIRPKDGFVGGLAGIHPSGG